MKMLKIGDFVKMTQRAVEVFWVHSPDHVHEFGGCTGIVVGFMFDDTDEYLDVRWRPSNLKYGYHRDELELA